MQLFIFLQWHTTWITVADIPQQGIDLIYDVPQLVVSISRWQFQLQDQAVNLVDADCDCQLLLDCMFYQPLCVQHHLWVTKQL